jgi:hypothetical protein
VFISADLTRHTDEPPGHCVQKLTRPSQSELKRRLVDSDIRDNVSEIRFASSRFGFARKISPILREPVPTEQGEATYSSGGLLQLPSGLSI